MKREVVTRNNFDRTLFSWLVAKYPTKKATSEELFSFYLKFLIAYIYLNKIGPLYHKCITWITRYYPFSLLYKGSLLHANAVKAKNLMRGMEDVAKRIGIPVYINNGIYERVFSIFYGKFEKKGINKQETIRKLQELFQDKYGSVYVQDEKTGFRVLVDSNLL